MTFRAVKTKDAAKAGTSPRHVQTETLAKGSKMNADSRITQMVPYPAQTPLNEFDQAMIRLRIIGKLIDSRQSLDLEDVNDVMTLLFNAIDTLEPIGLYLDEIEYEDGEQYRFIECRRRWLIERTQGAPE